MALSDTLVFIHGWGVNSSVWRHQIEYFSNKYYTNAPELNSLTLYPTPCTLHPVLIGWSYGGMRAIEMASKYPEKFKALVLVGCSAKFSDGMNPVIIRNITRNLKRGFEATMRNCYGTFFSAEETGFIDEFVERQRLPDKEETIELLDKLAALDLRGLLKDINMPTLIIHGDGDEVCPMQAGEYLYKNIKDSKLEVIKGAGHMPFYTRPQKFNSVLKEFIEGVE